ncbi:MAG: TIGR00730 family Rossman fold protein [Bacteroidota bacterium]
MERICVFCGSSSGQDPVYRSAAQEMGRALVKAGIGMVYGAGNVGLMGVIADEMLTHKAEVIGVIPDFLMKKEVGHTGISELIVVDTMHQRKALMAEKSDGFISMPGGYGTLDETFEIMTWAQLGLHQCPVGLLNVKGYYDPMLRMLDHMVEEGFLRAENRAMLLADSDPEQLLAKMDAYQAPDVEKWLNRNRL